MASARNCLLACGLLLAAACIVPDRDIRVIREDTNESPIRIVEPPPQSQQLRCDCAGPCEDLPPEEQAVLTCPVPPPSGMPRFLDPNDGTEKYQFCSCAEGRIDQKALLFSGGIEFYIEDQDAEDNAPKDELFAVLLLDLPPQLDLPVDASDYIAYRDAVDPRVALQNYTSTYDTDVILRPAPRLRSVFLYDVDTGTFDLCNGAGKPVSQGYHTLTLLVTDRPWFSAPKTSNGSTTFEVQDGVVDLTAGATYDSETFVFHCTEDNPDMPDMNMCFPDQSNCFCIDPQAEG